MTVPGSCFGVSCLPSHSFRFPSSDCCPALISCTCVLFSSVSGTSSSFQPLISCGSPGFLCLNLVSFFSDFSFCRFPFWISLPSRTDYWFRPPRASTQCEYLLEFNAFLYTESSLCTPGRPFPVSLAHRFKSSSGLIQF